MAKKHAYHHGDLRRALLQEAVRIIHKKGVDGLTLRVVGARLECREPRCIGTSPTNQRCSRPWRLKGFACCG